LPNRPRPVRLQHHLRIVGQTASSPSGKAQFTPQEKQGYDVFRRKGRCNDCHRDGGPGEDPLFTDFTASNIGTPANPDLPYYSENVSDDRGYVANKDGSGFVDGGVGAFLSTGHPLSQPSSIDARWKSLASQNRSRFQVPTLRNVDKRPSSDFVKAYGHNGYFNAGIWSKPHAVQTDTSTNRVGRPSR
jgi:cytochrome c peroxidase